MSGGFAAVLPDPNKPVPDWGTGPNAGLVAQLSDVLTCKLGPRDDDDVQNLDVIVIRSLSFHAQTTYPVENSV